MLLLQYGRYKIRIFQFCRGIEVIPNHYDWVFSFVIDSSLGWNEDKTMLDCRMKTHNIVWLVSSSLYWKVKEFKSVRLDSETSISVGAFVVFGPWLD